MPRFQETKLKNGLRILSEYHPNSKSVHMCYGVHVGSKDESKDLNGISHLIEHMVFKGTKKRSAYQISEEIELLGGDINAFTSRELTCFYTNVLNADYKQGLDILSDIVFDAKMDKKDLANEKQVVLHEMAMTEDLFEEQIFDDFYEAIYPQQSLGRPILGTVSSLERIDKKKIKDFIAANYRADNMYFVSCGGVKHDVLVKALKPYLKNINTQKFNKKTSASAKYQKVCKLKKTKTEQSHVVIGFPLSSFQDGTLYEASILNTFLGSGSTSVLFQELREKRPLCYSVYSVFAPQETSGMLLIYVGTDKKYLPEVIRTIKSTLQKIKTKGIRSQSVENIKKQWEKTLLMQSDDLDGRMNQILQDAILDRKHRSLKNIITALRKCSANSLKQYIDTFLDLEQGSMLLFSNMNHKEFNRLKAKFYE